jgi:glycosyltransferase involved in cell wall biosynthesis
LTGRLVFLTPGYSDPGGVARRSQALASAFADRGWRVLVLARAPHLWRPRLSRDRALTVVEIPGFGIDRVGSLLFLLCALPLGTGLGFAGASFLAIKLMSSSSTAALCGMLSGRPFVTMATSSGPDSEIEFLRGALRSHGAGKRAPWWAGPGLRLRRRLLRRAAFVVAQTPGAAGDLAQLIDSERIVVVPNPVAAVDAHPLTGRLRAVFTGRLSRQKDPLTLLDAWRMVVDNHPDARLTVVGEGGRHESVETDVRRRVAADSALRRSVRLTGWVPDVTPHLVAADVFVLPSLTEGMSNSLLEACALGRVAVASDIPPNRFVLGDGYPLLFPPGDADALARCLLDAFEQEAIRSDARARIAARMGDFTLEAVVDRLEGLIRSAPASPPPGRPGRRPPSASN